MFDCDWSSDVCSSDLESSLVGGAGIQSQAAVAYHGGRPPSPAPATRTRPMHTPPRAFLALATATALAVGTLPLPDRKSVVWGKSVDLGGRRDIKNNKQ